METIKKLRDSQKGAGMVLSKDAAEVINSGGTFLPIPDGPERTYCCGVKPNSPYGIFHILGVTFGRFRELILPGEPGAAPPRSAVPYKALLTDNQVEAIWLKAKRTPCGGEEGGTHARLNPEEHTVAEWITLELDDTSKEAVVELKAQLAAKDVELAQLRQRVQAAVPTPRR